MANIIFRMLEFMAVGAAGVIVTVLFAKCRQILQRRREKRSNLLNK